MAGAVWVAAAPAAYIAKVKDIERFEIGGGFKITRRISDVPRLEDFNDLHLTDDDYRDLRKCRIADCEVKLDAPWIERFRTEVHWGTPAARQEADLLFRRHALERVVQYRRGGNAALPVYNDRETPVAEQSELRELIDGAPGLIEMPDLQRFLLEYPRVSLERSSEMFYWQEVTFGLKRTFRITHLVIQDRGPVTVVASKMLYGSHYFWAALETRLLLPDERRGRGFWFVTTNRSRIDGLTGFIGRLIRGHVRSEAQKGALNMMSSAKSAVEGTPR